MIEIFKIPVRMFVIIINYFEINIEDQEKETEFYRSLRQLITIVFGIVFSVGLSELRDTVFWTYDFWLLILAYYITLQSWWGYHYGTITNVSEKNIINYFLDIFLIVQYYLLMIKRYSLSNVFERLIIIFIAYLIWEGIRLFNLEANFERKSRIVNAMILNFFFGAVLFIYKLCFDFNCTNESKTLIVVLMFLWMTAYRIFMHKIYRKELTLVSDCTINKWKQRLWPAERTGSGTES